MSNNNRTHTLLEYNTLKIYLVCELFSRCGGGEGFVTKLSKYFIVKRKKRFT